MTFVEENDSVRLFGDKPKIDYTVIGVDEAGRGPLFGPVVAAAVYFDEGVNIEGIADSKKLNEKHREKLYNEIFLHAKFGLGLATPEEIDLYNIFHATELAMNRALEILSQFVEIKNVFVDGKSLKLNFPAVCVVKGDAKIYQISAASILAKVTRDKIIEKFHVQYPEYNLIHHKGYPTKEHIDLLQKYGPTPFHRLTFEPVLELLSLELLDDWFSRGLISEIRYRHLLNLLEVDLFGTIRTPKRKKRIGK
ncbi:ribonuclease HII [Fervidobacterium islandicum]|uniref:Ribonuclease HII n=1 Tax=Fervidobacterium islandicum TaxID=2423 RepID=A0AAI8CMQ8_FERIS|nr:ribonuclease HII [Fervidobacterium islandicum]AMW33788.2 ribonuclease HII [Fervidobacterium islandicum]